MKRSRTPQPKGRSGPGILVLPSALLVAILVLGWAGTPTERRPSLDALRDAGWWVSLKDRLASAPSGAHEADPVVPARPPAAEAWIDPAALSWDWIVNTDPRWPDELRAVLGQLEPFPIADLDALADLRELLGSFSFVRSVPYLAASPEFGLEMELDLRVPVACVPTPDGFYTVDEEGVILSGRWPAPVQREGAPLPVIGPMADADALFACARPGDWLSEDEHLDALDVALSMQEHLSRAQRRELGRVVIDATRARVASTYEPGVRLLLGERRLVLFGRHPSSTEPGELPAAAKWESLGRAIEQRADPSEPFDWRTVDVRWDRPEIQPSEQLAAALAQSRAESRAEIEAEAEPAYTRVNDAVRVDDAPASRAADVSHGRRRVR